MVGFSDGNEKSYQNLFYFHFKIEIYTNIVKHNKNHFKEKEVQ